MSTSNKSGIYKSSISVYFFAKVENYELALHFFLFNGRILHPEDPRVPSLLPSSSPNVAAAVVDDTVPLSALVEAFALAVIGAVAVAAVVLVFVVLQQEWLQCPHCGAAWEFLFYIL